MLDSRNGIYRECGNKWSGIIFDGAASNYISMGFLLRRERVSSRVEFPSMIAVLEWVLELGKRLMKTSSTQRSDTDPSARRTLGMCGKGSQHFSGTDITSLWVQWRLQTDGNLGWSAVQKWGGQLIWNGLWTFQSQEWEKGWIWRRYDCVYIVQPERVKPSGGLKWSTAHRR